MKETSPPIIACPPPCFFVHPIAPQCPVCKRIHPQEEMDQARGISTKPSPCMDTKESIAKASQRRRLEPYAWSDLGLLPKRRPLIKGLLDCGAMSLFYGESNCGKTFLVLDTALHIVLGRAWQKRKTQKSKIVYIAAEGGLGLKERLDAFRIHNKLEGYAPFYLIPAGVDLCADEADAQDLIFEIQQLQDVALIVIDTLSRAMSGGNENSPDDMGAFIRNCDSIREATGAHILIVHHAGKDTSKGARGHSALRAAVDTEVEVINTNGAISAEVKKQRDGKTGISFYFELQPVIIGQDEDGENIVSCVVIPTEGIAPQKQKLSQQKRRALDIIRTCLIDRGSVRYVRAEMPHVDCITLDEAREALKLANIATSDNPDNVRRSISRVIDDLNNCGATSSYGDYIWIPKNNAETGSHSQK